MRENHDFVVPVNILTPLRTPRFLGPHDTLPCVLIYFHSARWCSTHRDCHLSIQYGVGLPWCPPNNTLGTIIWPWTLCCRAGRDGIASKAIIMFKKANRFTTKAMKSYAEIKDSCRRKTLYSPFINYEHSTNISKCKCCDNCAFVCSACKRWLHSCEHNIHISMIICSYS